MSTIAAFDIVVGANIRAAEQNMQRLGPIAESVGEKMRNALSIGLAVDLVHRGINLLQQSFGQLNASLFGSNSRLEQVMATFTAMTGSVGIAREAIYALRAEADKSPFDTEETIQAGKALITVAKGNTDEMMRYVKVAEQLAAYDPIAGMQGAAFALREAAGGNFMSLIGRFEIAPALIKKFRDQGKEGIDVVVAAMKEMGIGPELVEKLANTFSGRMSTITSFGKELMRVFGSGIFERASEEAGKFAAWLDQNGGVIKAWAADAGNVLGSIFNNLVTGFHNAIDIMMPLFRKIGDGFNLIGAGDFKGGWELIKKGVTDVLAWIWNSLTSFVSKMFGAGENLVKSYAEGITSAIGSVLQGAIDAIVNLISGFLIGFSPPKLGPLRQIGEGGKNIGIEWIKGVNEGIKGVEGIADRAMAGFSGKTAALPDISGSQGDFQAAIGNEKALEKAAIGVREVMIQIGDAMREIDRASGLINIAMSNIRAEAEAAKKPHLEALQIISERKVPLAEEKSLVNSLKQMDIDRNIVAAQGPPLIRLALGQRLEELGAQRASLELENRKRDILREQNDTRRQGLTDQLRAMDLEDRAYGFQQRGHAISVLKKSLKDADTKEERNSIEAQIKDQERGLSRDKTRAGIADKQAAIDKEDRLRKEADQKKLNALELEEIDAKIKIANLSNTPEIRRLQIQDAVLKADQARIDLAVRRQDIENQIAALPHNKAMADIDKEMKPILEDLQAQQDYLTRQKEQLGLLQQDWSTLSQKIGEANQRAAQAKKDAQDAKDALPAPGKPKDNTGFDPEKAKAEAQARGEEIAARLTSGFNTYMGEVAPKLMTGAITGVFASMILGPIGLPVGFLLGTAIYDGVAKALGPEKMKELSLKLTDSMATFGQAFTGNWRPNGVDENGNIIWVDPFVKKIGEIGIIAGDSWRTFVQALSGDWAPDDKKIDPFVNSVGKFALVIKEDLRLAGDAFRTARQAWEGDWAPDDKQIDPFVNNVGKFVLWIKSDFLPAWDEFRTNLGKIKDSIDWKAVGDGFKTFAEVAGNFLMWMSKNPDAVKNIVLLIAALAILGGIAGGIVSFATGIITLYNAFIVIWPFLAGIGAIFAAMTPIGWIITGIVVAFGLLYLAWTNNWGDIQGKTKAAIDFIGDRFNELGKFIEGIPGFFSRALKALDAWAKDMETKAGEGLEGFKKGFTEGFKKFSESVGGWLNQWVIAPFKKTFGIDSPSTVFTNLGDEIYNGFWNGISGGFTEFMKGVGEWIQTWVIKPFKAAFGISSPSSIFNTIGTEVYNGFWEGLHTPFDAFVTTIGTWIDTWIIAPIKKALGVSSPSTVFDTMGGDLYNGFWAGLKMGFDGFMNTIGTWINTWIISPVKRALGVDAGTGGAGQGSTTMNIAGQWTIQGLIDGFNKKVGEVEEWIKNTLGNLLPGWVKDVLGIHSPSTVFEGLGASMMDGLMSGIEGKWPDVETVIKRLGAKLSGATQEVVAPQGQIADFIRKTAGDMGFTKPDVAVRVAQSEGGLDSWNKAGDQNTNGIFTSFGPFQLHYGGLGTPHSSMGMGDDFTRWSGLDARNAQAGGEGVKYALNRAQAVGWEPFHGAKRVGIGNWEGIRMAEGGIINEHILGLGLSTGKHYQFGEGGRKEAVTPLGSGGGGSFGGKTLEINNTIRIEPGAQIDEATIARVKEAAMSGTIDAIVRASAMIGDPAPSNLPGAGY